MRGMFFRGVIVGSLTAALVVSASAALAGTGVGGIFNLGQSNTVNAQSSLNGSTGGAELTVANTSASGRGMTVNGKGAVASLLAQNTLGPAGAFLVPSGVSPFLVNSTHKVTNLNADQLDGIDASGFAQGNNVRFLSARVATPIDPTFPYVPIITVPGFGTLKGQCPNFNGVYDGFFHTSSSGWSDFYQQYDGAPFTSYYAGGGSFTQLQAGDGPGGGHITFVLMQGSGPSATTAVIDLYTNWDASSGCLFRPEVMISQGG
jgi:hypothetical protein